MERSLKHSLVAELQGVFSDAGIVIVTKNKGLTVKQARQLRRGVKGANSTYRVAKNRLVKIALQGTKFAQLDSLMSGPTAIAYSADPVGISKVLQSFAKENEKLEIQGGVMGDVFLTPAQIKTLSELPSLDELRGKIVGLLQAPASKIAAVLQAPAGQLARVVNAYAQK